MNEGDSAGGQRGQNLALPAGTDRRISSISSAGHLPVGPVVAPSPMSRSPADERQHTFQQLQQPMQSTASGLVNKPLQQQQQQQQHFTNSTVSLVPAGTVVGAFGAVHYNQQQFVSSSTNSGSNVIGGVTSVSNESNVIGVRTQSTAVIGSGNNNTTSASGIIIGNQSSGTVSEFGSNIGGANSGSTYIQTASGIVTGTSVVGPVGSVPVSPTARKRLALS